MKLIATLIAALMLAGPAAAAETIGAPARVSTSFAAWSIHIPVTAGDVDTAFSFQKTRFVLGPDPWYTRYTTVVPANTSRVLTLPCYATRAFYSYRATSPTQVGPSAGFKCG